MLQHAPNLITGTQKDPLLTQLLVAIRRAHHIEIAVSFVQPSGLELLFNDLAEALERGTRIDFLTSDYLNITHPNALRKMLLLAERGANVRIFECKSNVSFHLKTYIFTRTYKQGIASGCAFVGSNNISKTALTDGHEWAWRHDWQAPIDSWAAREFERVRQAFQELWQQENSVLLTDAWLREYQTRQRPVIRQSAQTLTAETTEPPAPYAVQMEALEALQATRAEGFKRGLVVLATGMGKTYLAAFDSQQMQAKRVLFVAHREEILLQAQKSFTTIAPQFSTGLYKAEQKDIHADFLFASIQSLRTEAALQQFAPDHFDYIVVDEFHHASAPSYRALLEYFAPQFLLGLTATPERTDQADILALCDNNLVFERNLVHGIDGSVLAPFHYYGILDEYVNYEEIPWRSGRFDPTSLENAFATMKRAEHIYQHWLQYKQTRTMGFCVSRRHADYMANFFTQKGVRAVAVYSNSNLTRGEALTQLEQGEVDVVFSVDLFNEGTDIPSLDTLLMLRPTESKIIFLQQLGRGLRLSKATNKSHLVVLDFLGNHQAFLQNPATLFDTHNPRDTIAKAEQNQDAAISLAEGCYVNFDPKLLEFWQVLKRKLGASAVQNYQELREELGRRPTAAEYYYRDFSLTKMRKEAGSWLGMLAEKEGGEYTELLEAHGEFFLDAVETTRLTKSFKAYLYLALVQLGGVAQPVSVIAVAKQSRLLLERRPDRLDAEVANSVKSATGDSKEWLSYWRKNPIHFSCQKDKRSVQAWFKEEAGSFGLNFTVAAHLQPIFATFFRELIDLRLAEYFNRPKVKAAFVAEEGEGYDARS